MTERRIVITLDGEDNLSAPAENASRALLGVSAAAAAAHAQVTTLTGALGTLPAGGIANPDAPASPAGDASGASAYQGAAADAEQLRETLIDITEINAALLPPDFSANATGAGESLAAVMNIEAALLRLAKRTFKTRLEVELVPRGAVTLPGTRAIFDTLPAEQER